MNIWQWRVATVFYTFLLTYSSLKPGDGAVHSQLEEIIHNSLHVPGYLFLTTFLILALQNLKEKVFVSAGIIAFSYGVLMEIFQGLQPTRDPSFSDVCLNTSGILLAIFFCKKSWIKYLSL